MDKRDTLKGRLWLLHDCTSFTSALYEGCSESELEAFSLFTKTTGRLVLPCVLVLRCKLAQLRAPMKIMD